MKWFLSRSPWHPRRRPDRGRRLFDQPQTRRKQTKRSEAADAKNSAVKPADNKPMKPTAETNRPTRTC